MISTLAAVFADLDEDDDVRACVLCSSGTAFCAGANFAPSAAGNDAADLYRQAARLFANRKPVVGAIHGPAVGGGLGLALFPDFRIASAEARFSANFARLGFHHGFGLSVTLPALVGQQFAMDMLLTGRRVKADEALAHGLCDRLVDGAELRPSAIAFATEIARSAPLAVLSIRATMRGDLAERIAAATEHELAEQTRLRRTADFAEGIAAMADRRLPEFTGR